VLLLINPFVTVFAFVDCRTLWGSEYAVAGLSYVQVPYLFGRFLGEYKYYNDGICHSADIYKKRDAQKTTHLSV
jgi:hypothetical protein